MIFTWNNSFFILTETNFFYSFDGHRWFSIYGSRLYKTFFGKFLTMRKRSLEINGCNTACSCFEYRETQLLCGCFLDKDIPDSFRSLLISGNGSFIEDDVVFLGFNSNKCEHVVENYIFQKERYLRLTSIYTSYFFIPQFPKMVRSPISSISHGGMVSLIMLKSYR